MTQWSGAERDPIVPHCVLISTYDLGRQPFGLASPAAWLEADGWDVTCVDLAKEPLRDDAVASADLVGFHLPMHTATRLAGPVVETVRRINPAALVCAYGLYAPLNAEWLRSLGVDAIFGGEFEADLTEWARARVGRNVGPATIAGPARSALPRLRFLVPSRRGLPPLARYATLQRPDGARALAGYTEATRGCKHLCRHCPVVPIYDGQFRTVQADVVLADIEAQIAAGAGHITFGDPDFFNGPAHALRIVEALHRAHPAVSYDATIKIEHLLRHRTLLPSLARTGCAFVTSAVESVDDHVLALLRKGHTRADFLEAVSLCRAAGLTIAPTFVAFHPWTTLDGYRDLIDTISDLDLVENVAPIQLGIRLLVPQGSRLLELEEMRRHLGEFDANTLTYRWAHPDPRVDALQREVSAIVGARLDADRPSVFDEIASIARDCAGVAGRAVRPRPARDRATVPFLNEPWYC
jgi:radical SAM superfamily enzyme YgiQ (UPF0313 family)